MSTPDPPSRPYDAITHPNYRLYAAGFLCSSMGLQMLGTAVGWEIYERTGDPLHLGYAGLARALPVVLLALFAGHAADVYSRRWILGLTQLAFALSAGALAVASARHAPVAMIYGLLILMGAARSFNAPSRNSLLPLLIPARTFHNAVTWNSILFHLAATLGPILAGVMIARSGEAWPVYAATAGGTLLFAISVLFLRPEPQPKNSAPFSLSEILAGASHIWRERTVFAAITLDLLAVLLGGATALLPVYAKDILHTDATGLGILRAAPFVGAFLMGLVLAHRPPFRAAGPALLASVAGFGVCMILFGVCTSFWPALACLFLSGCFDNVSVVIRHVLVPLRTPDRLRGRVSAVNAMFIECSNELSGFESGLVARVFGPVASVVSGGIGTLLVVAVVAAGIPQIRRLRRIEEIPPTG